MSLSQQYAGKILTPWFNVAEWKATKALLYSDSKQLALEHLKIWKVRTPLLSAGIEGTIILLEALLEEQKDLTNYEMAQIFSTALLRFLNICAASNDRQGTFYKTAEKNDLPYWLITLRHDIAHDHKIPSNAILKCGLNKCFQWIKQKYWNIQELHMKDYVVSEETDFKPLFNQYARLNLSCFHKQDMEELFSTMKNEYGHILHNDIEHDVELKDFIVLVEDYLLQFAKNDKIKDSSIQMVSSLIEENIILSVSYCLVNDVKRIPMNFIKIWIKIINFLHKNDTLYLLINKLVDVTETSSYKEHLKEIASLWIAELYQGFLKLKKMKEEYDGLILTNPEKLESKTAHLIIESMYDKNPLFKNIIALHESEKMPDEDSRLLEERILRKPNEYTLNYLELVLKFNGHTNDFIKKQCNNVKKLVQSKSALYIEADIIHTIKDLPELNKYKNNVTIKRQLQKHSTNNIIGEKRKFRKLTEAAKFCFKNYPLGLLSIKPS